MAHSFNCWMVYDNCWISHVVLKWIKQVVEQSTDLWSATGCCEDSVTGLRGKWHIWHGKLQKWRFLHNTQVDSTEILPRNTGWWFGTLDSLRGSSDKIGTIQRAVGPEPSSVGAAAHADLGQVCATSIAMARSFPMDWGSIDNGSKIDLLCRTVVFDIDHDLHIMELFHNCSRFHMTGLLEAGYESYTIFDATLVAQFPVPHVSLGPSSCILGHKEVTWDSLFSVVDMCSGFGGFTQGMLPCGFHSTVAVDHNQHMLKLFKCASNIPTILGDVGSKAVIKEVWQASQGAKTMTGGFSCQPFSYLGDGRGSEDPRSSCLSKILYSAFYLRTQVLVLECVAPASQDPFVRAELDHFCQITGFHCSQRT